ncbi:MAG: caspase family protein [Elusimicrobia bacterium]|nr:caspase family protein [Elusimicrobiota bacterium]
MARALLLAAVVLGATLAGCAGGQTTDDADAKKNGRFGGDCSSTLRACLLEGPGTINNIRIEGLRAAFASAVYDAHPTPQACDVVFSFPRTFSDAATVTSAYNRELLGRFESNNFVSNIQDACRLLSDENGDAFRRIPGSEVLARRPRPAAAPAAAPSAPAPTAGPTLPPPVMPNFSAPDRPDDFAVVVGVEDYPDLPKAAYAERDAAAFKAHVRALGVPERNIAYLSGTRATKSALEKNVETWLPRLVKPDSRVYFYFSGHGAPDAASGEAYLVPVDGDPNFLANTGYPVRRLYERLGMLPAKQVLVAMDACFSGAGGRSLLATGARPLLTRIETGTVPRNVVALTASASNEISGSLDLQGHGAFTYFLLKGLDGAAKDASGRVTPKSLIDYARPRVQDEARRLNRDQTPQLLGGDAGLVLR